MTLSPAQTRRFTVAFLALLLGLSVVAAVAITRGWANPTLQRDVARNEAAHDAAMPRLGGAPGDSTRIARPERLEDAPSGGR